MEMDLSCASPKSPITPRNKLSLLWVPDESIPNKLYVFPDPDTPKPITVITWISLRWSRATPELLRIMVFKWGRNVAPYICSFTVWI